MQGIALVGKHRDTHCCFGFEGQKTKIQEIAVGFKGLGDSFLQKLQYIILSREILIWVYGAYFPFPPSLEDKRRFKW